MSDKKPLDQVILVDEQDQQIGTMDKVEAHRGEGKLHRAVSVYLFRKNGDKIELLIQQRSTKKIVGAGQWANTICGNVRPGETRPECALRRLREELGITKATVEPMYIFTYQVACNQEFSEHEIDQVFVGYYDGLVKPNPDEAQQVEWADWTELLAAEGNKLGDKELAPWFVWMLNDIDLIKEIQNFLDHD
jgi:isopentenyl-diphosphate Delta-isomerase